MIVRAPKSNNQMTYNEAILYCVFCNHDGYNDWRLPTAYEYQHNGIGGWYVGRQTFVDWWVTPVRDVYEY